MSGKDGGGPGRYWWDELDGGGVGGVFAGVTRSPPAGPARSLTLPARKPRQLATRAYPVSGWFTPDPRWVCGYVGEP